MLYTEFGSKLSIANIDSQLKLILEHEIRLNRALSGRDPWITMEQLEKLVMDLNENQKRLNKQDLEYKLKKVNLEDTVIRQKKNDLARKGVKLRNFRRYKTSIMTMLGRVSLERMALIPCTVADKNKLAGLGHTGFVCPLDEALGLDGLPFKMTVPAMLEVAYAGCTCDSFEDAEKHLEKRTNIRINDDTLRRVTSLVGSLVRAEDACIAARIWEKNKPWLFAGDKKKIRHTLYFEVDGAMFRTRETNGQGDSAWKENKLGVAFSTDNFLYWFDKNGKKRHRVIKKEYVSIIGDAEDFKKAFYSLAIRNGYGKYRDAVLISDGATWIRNLKNELFNDDVQQILDYYHIKKHVYDFAKDVYDFDEIKYVSLAKKICNYLINSKYRMAIDIIKSLGKKLLSKHKFDLINYIINNKDNIDYHTYIKKGYFIGSGAVESGNKTVLQRRLKLPGMRWNVETGKNMVALTAKVKSLRWESDVVPAVRNRYRTGQQNSFKIAES